MVKIFRLKVVSSTGFSNIDRTRTSLSRNEPKALCYWKRFSIIAMNQ